MSKPRMVGLRVYLCLSGVLSAYSIVDSTQVFSSVDELGRYAAFALLLTVCLLGMFDAVVNDVLGERWQLQWAAGLRHDGYIALSIVNLALIFVAVSRGTEGTHLMRFALDAAVAVYVAFKDVQLRYIEPRKESRPHADHHA